MSQNVPRFERNGTFVIFLLGTLPGLSLSKSHVAGIAQTAGLGLSSAHNVHDMRGYSFVIIWVTELSSDAGVSIFHHRNDGDGAA